MLGVNGLHGDGFSMLNTIFTLFYGGFLQVFQTAMGWKQIKGSDIAKIYQQQKSLVNIVYIEVLRVLHYMHVASFISSSDNTIITIEPARLGIEMVLSFYLFLDNKI